MSGAGARARTGGDPDAVARCRDEVLARTSIAAVIGRVIALPAGRGRRRVKVCCPFHHEKTPSFHVVDGHGWAHCFGCGWHGNAIDFLAEYEHVTWREALAELALRAGVALPPGWEAPARPVERRATPAPVVAAPDPGTEAELTAWGIERARAIWAAAGPVAGSPAERYLRSRGLVIPAPPTLRCAEALAYWHAGEQDDRPRSLGLYPALVCAVQGPDGRVCGVQRVYLAPVGEGKVQIPDPDAPDQKLPAKKSTGVIWRGALRLGGAGAELIVAEGPETGLSLIQALGLISEQPWRPVRPVWATLSLNNLAGGGRGMGAPHPDGPWPDGRQRRLPSVWPDRARPGVVLPGTVRLVAIAEDADNKDPAAADALYSRAARRWAREGRGVTRFRPPPGMDFNDLLRGAA